MVIKSNTKNRTISEKKHKSDKKIPDNSFEARVSNMLAIAIAVQADKFFKKTETKEAYIDMLCTTAKRLLNEMNEEESSCCCSESCHSCHCRHEED